MSILSDSHSAGSLPPPSADAAAHSRQLVELIITEIAANNGWLSFARYMDLALHAPGLGYYSAGACKFGAEGDFVTAPELGSLFARTLARQVAQVLNAGISDVLEVGPGSGQLACQLLRELSVLDCLPARYLMLETSAELRQRQRTLLERELPDYINRIIWLDRLPPSLDAIVIANEALDAMPVHLIKTRDDGVDEVGVIENNGNLTFDMRPATGTLLASTLALELPPDYTTEIASAAPAFIRTLASTLQRGVMIFIDYGFPQREYYHPQRNSGTLMCHYRHRTHPDALLFPGLQDITAHVDFSAIAAAGEQAGCALLGYVSQAQFLINCGLTDVLSSISPDYPAYRALAAETRKLTTAEEMGELFKVIALGKNFDQSLLGFARGDRTHTL